MPAYLDNAASTAMLPEAVTAMLPFLTEHYANSSSSHAPAREARAAVEDARETLASALGADPGEVVFTSGGTESNNLAVAGCLRSQGSRSGGQVACSAVEHRSVLTPCAVAGARLVPVDRDGRVDPDVLARSLSGDESLVSIMLANNEVGTVQPLGELAGVVREHAPHAVLHTDAVQGFTWLDVPSYTDGWDLVSVSAHKFGGPKGVGALVVRGRAEVEPVLRGGGHERGRRSGTLNVAGIVAMAVAARATCLARSETVARVEALRARLADGLLEAVPDAVETGRRDAKIAGNCHLMFPGVEAEELLVLLDEMQVYASAGSACSSGAVEPSHVLLAMGMSRQAAARCVRFSLGASTTEAEVDHALEVVPKAVAQLRG